MFLTISASTAFTAIAYLDVENKTEHLLAFRVTVALYSFIMAVLEKSSGSDA
jgi:hypothetical protein